MESFSHLIKVRQLVNNEVEVPNELLHAPTIILFPFYDLTPEKCLVLCFENSEGSVNIVCCK